MPRLDREQSMSIAALAALLLLCLYVVGMLLQARADAAGEASERREMLSRLEARLKTISSQPVVAAPPSAFLDASTRGLAGAQLQSYLAQVAGDQNASLVSSGADAAKRDDSPETIRLQVTLDMSGKALRAVLYRLESGAPYVFVDALAIQPAGGSAGRTVEDPLLRATLGLRAVWRRGST
jgi:general secretion pathway protein M